jgi:hypothetical protein
MTSQASATDVAVSDPQQRNLPPDSNPDFVPNFQIGALVLAILNAVLLMTFGVLCLFFPQLTIQWTEMDHARLFPSFIQEEPCNKLLETVVRLCGGLLVSQALACALLLYPMIKSLADKTNCWNSSRQGDIRLWNLQTCLAVQSVTSLMWVVVGLLNDRSGITAASTRMSMFGFLILMVSFFGLMASFWPVAGHRATDQSSGDLPLETTNRAPTENGVGVEQLDSLTEPLLTRTQGGEEHNENDNLQAFDEERQQDLADDDSTNTDEGHEEDAEPTSRIRGTRRLLSLAAPQVIYLYIGCITLLIRLPFSLAIPHFVSTTLGALSRNEFEQARREVFWLFILGTIDAW